METEKQQSMHQTYRQFMQIGLNGGDPGLLRKIVDEHISGFGSAMDEKVHGFDGLSKLLDTQIKQSKGLDIRWRMEPVSQFVTPDENTAVFADDVFLRIDSGEEIIEMYLRFSAVLNYTDGQWKVIHWHGSKPEAVESEQDTWGLESWKQKAGELEKLVAEKTSDLVEKNRELEIEAALERVRARTMAMQKSDELPEAANLLFQQVQSLGMPAWSAGYCTWNDDKSAVTLWMSSEGVLQPPFIAPTTEDELFKQMRKGLEDGKDLHICEMGGKDLELHYQYMRTLPVVGKILDSIIDAGHPLPTFQIMHQAYFSKGFLLFITYEPVPEAHEIFKRFASVFDQTYTRFLDLQKAEAQAREAEIQLALERVRARTMAMHKSDELAEVAVLLFQQVKALGITTYSSGFTIWNTGENVLFSWMCNADGSINPPFIMPATEYDWHRLQYQSWKNKEDHIVHDFTGEEMERHYRYLRSFPLLDEAFRKSEQAGIETPVRQVHNVFNFSYGNLLFITLEPAEECFDVFSRFSKVFEQCYTRFLDLQKAEAQAREAQIETALERIRARALAMHNSNELTEVAKVLREQMSSLGQPELETSAVHLYDEDPDYILSWRAFRLSSYLEGNITYGFFKIPKGSCEIANEFIEKFKSSETDYTIEVSGARQAEWYKILFKLAPEVHEAMKNSGTAEETRYYHFSKFSGGALLMVSSKEPSKDAIELQKRSAQVFDLAYRRFKDLQKVEEQAREAQIEAALERLRSRSMAMHDSSDLSAVVFAMFTELVKLDAQLDRCLILIVNPQTLGITWYLTGKEGLLSNNGFLIPDNDHPSHKAYLDGWRTKRKKWQYFLAGEEKKQWDAYGFSKTELSELPDFIKADMAAVEAIHLTISSDDFGCLIASSLSPLSDVHAGIVERFTLVFNQTYTRFLDLQKAEAQTREAQIEASLERVRSRSMAMHKSEEFPELIQVVFEQFQQLNFKIDSAQFDVSFRESDDLNLWAAAPGQPYPTKLHIPYADYEAFNAIKKAKKAGLEFVSSQFTKEEKNDFFEYFFLHVPDIPEERKKLILSRPGMVRSVILLDQVSLAIQNYSGILYSDAEHSILKRFAKAFEQSYIRFLDLQKAEAQAREAQIEAALERVRARAMAMHASQELSEVVHELRKQMGILGQKDLETCVIHLHDESPDFIQSWAAIKPPDEEGDILESIANVPKKGLNIIEEALEAYTAKHHDYVILNEGEKLRQWFSFLRKEVPEGFAKLVESVQGNIEDLRSYWSFSDFSGGSLLMVTRDKPDESTRSLLRRFTNVFGLAYRRFADLKYAEAIAREAQIQTGLEKLRARTMAMHKSSELTSVVKVMFNEFKSLQVGDDLQKIVRAFITNANQSAGHFELWATDTDGAELKQQYVIRYDEPTNGVMMHDAWLNKKPWFVNDLTGERLKQWIQYLTNIKFVTSIEGWGVRRVNTFIYYSKGFIGVTTLSPLSNDSIELLRRFAAVFEQTYTRFLDLQQAEANALEATRRASIERVRGEIASMRTPDDLERITPLVWNELTALGVPFFRCGVFIINENGAMVHVYLSTPEGKSIARLHLPFGSSQITDDALASWRKQEVYKTHWGREDFQTWVQTLVQQGYLQSEQQYKAGDEAPEHLWLHYIPFAQGMLYVGSDDMLNDEHLALVHALADAFATAYARYEDFTRLEEAKRQIEKTLEDLKATQRQLIQSEKMASLGELTAGIAHEIQNPLNFVNNFSEVSKELIEEMKEELAAGSWQLAVEIAADISQNLEKINHHGKRADAIVKGMLQHSRNSSGQKEPTDINALCDEYLRLAYHGLKAKDKSFNARFEFLPDQTLPEVNVMQQEIGRVVLNLINNAFYAVKEKVKSETANVKENFSHVSPFTAHYEPKVIISTKNMDGKVEIIVKDNGMGIPDKVMEKIFQPFFTTKPTGEGTGLGLSLSYDIIKAHGGELKVETKEGEETSFHIYLPIEQ